MVKGVSGDYGPSGSKTIFAISGSTNITLSSINYYAGNNASGYFVTDPSANYVQGVALGLFQLGNYNINAFPYCGDGVWR